MRYQKEYRSSSSSSSHANFMGSLDSLLPSVSTGNHSRCVLSTTCSVGQRCCVSTKKPTEKRHL